MMRFSYWIAAIAFCAALASCAGEPQPPAGRWQGYYEAGDVMIVARLEISTKGVVRVSAPDAFTDIAKMNDQEKLFLRTQLEESLAQSWPAVGPMDLTYDGEAFRKPGGVAPQIEWDSRAKRMTLMVYPGLHAMIRVPLEAVDEFGQSTKNASAN